jgi:Fe2+ or Zn2+ uptake regulation protein
MGELELVFHDTVPLEEERLPEARKRAARQKEAILDYFRQRYSMNFTPREIWSALVFAENPMTSNILLTSVRRAISDLTKEGKLAKCDYSERRDGGYGHPNRTWKYCVGYLPSLNKKR